MFETEQDLEMVEKSTVPSTTKLKPALPAYKKDEALSPQSQDSLSLEEDLYLSDSDNEMDDSKKEEREMQRNKAEIDRIFIRMEKLVNKVQTKTKRKRLEPVHNHSIHGFKTNNGVKLKTILKQKRKHSID